ncbi:hypothetical protein DL766_001544 [Monosporascus sp. MC13-8B]|uniref:Uncharacterized protein n=1 Tax=Monosporascus cannonballus TaxID=155416 RepID=A0ABY0H278_9PEZI|nr:hypothetical protein DL762_007812 [Monosporascus cannonballus]RYO90756.1 hypothetical protein DL763_005225 [Monosporascus cannonballus]RYP37393.1 hypothetical protein DL766_001544 [Monosporascus sp. MC13-8B]
MLTAPVDIPTSGAKKLGKMLEEMDELIVYPGVYNSLSRGTVIELGFSARYMTGPGTIASRLGQPDFAIAQLHDMHRNAKMIASLDPFGPPLIADMDTGYEGFRSQHFYTKLFWGQREFPRTPVLTKRYGHLSGKKVVPRDEYLARIQMLGYDECIAWLRAARSQRADWATVGFRIERAGSPGS